MTFSESIKVDLYGQYNNNTEHVYSYPEKITNQYSFTESTRWAAPITDPRALFQSVCKSGPCYIVHRHKNGYYYSYVERNAADSRGGLEMITIFIPAGRHACGGSVLDALGKLRDTLILAHRYDDELVRNCIACVTECHSKEFFPVKTKQDSTGQPTAAFRTFKDETELRNILTFLKQKEYADIDKLLLVPEYDMKEGSNIQRITAPVMQVFNVVACRGAVADREEVSLGEAFRVTYTKDDFEPLIHDVRLSAISVPAYVINGNDVCLRSPEALGISFSKKLFVNVESNDGKSQGFIKAEVMFNGMPAERSEDGRVYVMVPETAVLEGSSAALDVNATHFEPYHVSVALDGLRNNSVFNVRLPPKTRVIPVEFHFGDTGSDDACTLPFLNVPVKETDPMYNSIVVNKKFHGYDAVGLPGEGFRVNIPDNDDWAEEKTGWLKIVLIVVGILIVSLALVCGGYVLGHFDVLGKILGR